jgi:SecD/SecF fusion protein
MSGSETAHRKGWWKPLTWLVVVAGLWCASGPRLAWSQDAPAQAANETVQQAPQQRLISPAEEQAEQQAKDFQQFMINVAIVVAIFVVSMMAGNALAKAVRLNDQSLKFTIIIFAIVASLAVTIARWPPKLGIDLSGGVILVYEIDQSQKQGQQNEITRADTMNKLVEAIIRRINPGGQKEILVRPYGEAQIEIIIPDIKHTPGETAQGKELDSKQELERIQYMIQSSGALEFRIVASQRVNSEIINRAKAMPLDETELEDTEDGQKVPVAKWVPVENKESSLDEFKNNPDNATRVNKRGRLEVLVLYDHYNVTGNYLANAKADFDQSGRPAVMFAFNSEGARRFGGLTGENKPIENQNFRHKLGIILDRELVTAPAINSRIEDRGEITGNFTQEETKRLASVLTAGQLPTALQKEPSTVTYVGPTLGQETIRTGVSSMLVATGVVVVFMLFYYRFAGIVANLAVVFNVLLTVAFMILFHAAFTLSGLAGLALTVGMAVDANVLIYERMREELARGATLRMAIRNGFERATTTIIDANVTTLISAVVLFAIGTDQVKGFAVTLILGIVMNLFTAITFSRAIFDIAEKMRWIKNLKMMQILSNTNYDFIGKRVPAIALSWVIIAIGLVGVWNRGAGLLDIDFTGGSSVEVLFDKEHPQTAEKVRDAVDALPDVTVQNVHIAGESTNLRFRIVTSQPDVQTVEEVLRKAFPEGQLASNQMEVTEAGPITAATPAANPGTAPAPAPKPDADKSSQVFTPDENLLALADTQNEPAKDAKEDVKKDEAQTEKPAAKSDEKAAEKPASDKPVNDSQKKPEPAKTEAPAKPVEHKPAEPAKTDAAKAEAPADPFVGGTQAKLRFGEPISHDKLEQLFRSKLEAMTGGPAGGSLKDTPLELDNPEYQTGSHTGYRQWTLKIGLPQDKTDVVIDQVKASLRNEPVFPSSSKVGASVATNTQLQAIYALLASMALILVYVWFRFSQVMFGFAAIVALVHDVLVTLGALALSYWIAPYLGWLGVEQFKINLPVIAAFLTIIGYSLNDTIVIFDRIRELRGKSPDLTADLVNLCVNQTLSRTLLTSLTVFLVVVILYAMGGEGIHGFAFALVIGVITGTYSTIYIATPVLIWLNNPGDKSKFKLTGSNNAVAETSQTR